jgi:uncharacterized protein (TIGR03437 family)
MRTLPPFHHFPAAMSFLVRLWLLAGSALLAAGPVYSALSLVNAADSQVGWLAPNAIASLYGTGLAYSTVGLTTADLQGGVQLPTTLPGTGVTVLVGGLAAFPYYISPKQVNFLIPNNLLPGPVEVQLVVDGIAGPAISVTLGPTAPALFELDPQTAVAVRPDASVIDAATPASPGDWAILYGNALGPVTPPVPPGQIAPAAAQIQLVGFVLSLDGVTVPADHIEYVGAAPGFAGLYQINLLIPPGTGPNPEIQIGVNGQMSRTGLHLAVQLP